MSSQSAAQFNRGGPRARRGRPGSELNKPKLPERTLEYFRNRARERKGTALRYPAHKFVDERLRLREGIMANTFSAKVGCDGEVHTVRAKPGGALFFANHSRSEMRALRVLAELTGKPCGCLAYAQKLRANRAKKSFQPVLDEARTRHDARLYVPKAPRGDRWEIYGTENPTQAAIARHLRTEWDKRVHRALGGLRRRLDERFGWELRAIPRQPAEGDQGPPLVMCQRPQKLIEFRYSWRWCRLLIGGLHLMGDRLVLAFDRMPGASIARVQCMELVIEQEQVPAKIEVVKPAAASKKPPAGAFRPRETIQVTRRRVAEALKGVRIVDRVAKWQPADQFSPAGWRVIE